MKDGLASPGTRDFAPLFLRVPLGAYALLEGLWWTSKTETLARVLEHSARMSPGVLLSFYAQSAPYIFMLAGVLLILGFLNHVGAFLLFIALLIPLGYSGIFTFGGELLERRNGWKTIVLMFSAFSLLISGPGALSVDRWRGKGG